MNNCMKNIYLRFFVIILINIQNKFKTMEAVMDIIKYILDLDFGHVFQMFFYFIGIIIISQENLKSLSKISYCYIFFSIFSVFIIRHRLNEIVNISILIFSFIFSQIFIKNNFIKTFNIVITLKLLSFILDFLEFIISYFFDFRSFSNIIFTFIIYIVIGFLLIKILESVNIPYGNKTLLILLSFLTLIFYLIIFLLHMENYSSEMFFSGKQQTFFNLFPSSKIFPLLFSIICFIMAFILLKLEQEKKLNNYYESLEKNYNEIRQFRHDYKNLVLTLGSLIEKDDIDDIRSFYNDFTEYEVNSALNKGYNLDRISKINIKYLKGFLYSKLREANEKNIEIYLDISDEIDYINIKNIDLIRILGIVIDNAIEEIENMKDSKISIAFISLENSIVIIVENTCREDIEKIFKLTKKGYSTKGKYRGLGLYNLERIISNYNNITHEVKIENNLFLHKFEIYN